MACSFAVVEVRTWLSLVAVAGAFAVACGGKSTVERAGAEPGVGGTTPGSGGTAQPGSGGASGTTPGSGGSAQPGSGGASGTPPGSGGTAPVDTGGTGFVGGDGGAGTGGRSGATAGGASGATAGGTSGDGGAGTPGGSGGIGASGGEAPGSCDEVVPCGGDLDGAWTVIGSCLDVRGLLDVSVLGFGCSSATVTGSLVVSGTFIVEAETETVADWTTTTGTEDIELAPECLLISGTTTTCERVSGPLQALGYAAVVCDDADGGGCTCLATVDQEGGMAYVSVNPTTRPSYIAGDGVLTTSDGFYSQGYEYCVAQDFMLLSPKDEGLVGTATGAIAMEPCSPPECASAPLR